MSRNRVIMTVDGAITVAQKRIVLIGRAKPPFEDKLVMPGGHVEDDETLKAACVRELQEEIGLTISESDLELLTVLDVSDRDPREGRRVSVVFHVDLDNESCLAQCSPGSDAEMFCVRKIASLQADEIGFDHFDVISLL